MSAPTIEAVAAAVMPASRTHDLWIGTKNVLAIRLDTNPIEFQPEMKQVKTLNNMIQGLARAARAVVYHAEHGENPEFLMQPVEDIADAIILLSQLSMAVQEELASK